MLGEVFISLELAELQDGGLGNAPEFAHLLRKAIGLHEVGGLRRAVGDERAAPMLANHQAKALELLKSQAHRSTGKTIALRQLALGWHKIAGTILVVNLLGQNVN